MPETIVLDPSEVATSRTQLDITPWVGEEGIDWGDADIAAYMADEARGSVPVDYRVPNRTITIPLVLKTKGGTAFATARTNVQAKAALFQREGGYLKRLTSTGGTVFADVVDATLKLGGGWLQAHRNADTEAQLVLQVRPDFYGAEVTLSDHVSAGQAELVFTETGIQGDYPARCRVVVDEDEAQSQLGLIWGWRSRNYSSAATARLAYNGGTLTPQGGGTVSTTVMRDAAVPGVWTPVLKTDIVPSGALTHVGTYRVWAQVQPGTGATDLGVDVRLVWGVGGLSVPVENAAARLPGPSHAYTVDLGEVRLDASPEGAHRWQGQVQARAATPPADVTIRKVWVVPVDEGYGVLRAPPTAVTSFTAFSARDEFNQTAGVLAGKTATVGGVWAGAGDADDYSVETTGKTAQRTAISDDSSFLIGRYAVSGVAASAAQAAQVDWKTSSDLAAVWQAVLLRYTDTNNWVIGLVVQSANGKLFQVYKRIAGVASPVSPAVAVSVAENAWFTTRMTIDAAGRWHAWVFPQGATLGDPLVFGQDATLATGGALASGKPGFYDTNPSAIAATRNYDNFLAYAPTLDAVLHPSQSAELRWDGLYREDATGAAYGPVPDGSVSDYPRLPPAGLEGRTLEVFMRASRGDFSQLPDNDYDDLSARIFYRPCWLFVP